VWYNASMEIQVYTKTKKLIVVVKTNRGDYVLTEQGIEPQDSNLDFGEGADWVKTFEKQ